MKGSRVREFRLPLTVVFGGSSAVGLVLCLILASVGVDIRLNLAIVGLVLAILVPLGIEIHRRAGRTRRVLILDYRNHEYGHAVARGIMRILSKDKRRWNTEVKSPSSASTTGALQWQIQEIQAADNDEVDGIALIPVGDHVDLWNALVAVIKSGIFVVVADTKPPNRVFRKIGIEPPRFVSSRYSKTGVLIGQTLNQWLAAETGRRCLLWNGPAGSWPGEERSRNILYELATALNMNRCTLYPIDSWTPNAKRCRDTIAFVKDSPSDTAVYCADDENAMALHLLTLTEAPSLRSRMMIIGCNGTPDDWGNVQAVDILAVDTTIDILSEEQGTQIGHLFVKERTGRLSPAERSVFIEPELLRRTASGSRWHDSIFNDKNDSVRTAHAGGDGSHQADDTDVRADAQSVTLVTIEDQGNLAATGPDEEGQLTTPRH